MKVLIVEDEALVAEDLRRRLRDGGATSVVSVATGEAALRSAEVQSFDVAIIDVRLKDDIDGTAVGRSLADDGVAVIYLTGQCFIETLLHARDHSVDVLRKPFSEFDLRRALVKARGRGGTLVNEKGSP